MAENGTKFAVVGLGNEYRGDDAIGLLTADRVRTALVNAGLNDRVCVSANRGDPADLIDRLTRYERVIIIDAARGSDPVGTIALYEPLHQPINETATGANLHSFSLNDTIELALSLDNTLFELLIFGVTGIQFNPGQEVNQAVLDAGQKVADQVMERLADWLSVDKVD